MNKMKRGTFNHYNKGLLWNTRGISTIVATVLMILITLAAFAILAGFIVPFVRDTLQESTSCLDYRDYFTFVEEFDGVRYNCFDVSNQGISVKAKNLDEEIDVKEFGLVFGTEGDSKSVGLDELRVLGSAVEKRAPNPGETITYVYETNVRYDTIDIYPILKSGDACEVTDSIKIVNCDGVDLTK